MPISSARPAIFFDRDGTLIEDRGYLHSPSEIVFYKETLPALERIKDRYLLFIVTNQPGIGLGILGAEEVDQVNRTLVERLARSGVTISGVYTCPHTRDQGCDCIKPKPTFLLKAAEQFHVDLSRSFVVGDHPHDVEMGLGVGTEGVLLLTGHGQRHLGELERDEKVFIARNLGEAVTWILLEDSQRKKIREAARILKRGGVVAFPTETVYGLGANAFDPLAVARLFEVKKRPYFDPLIVHISNREHLPRLTTDLPRKAEGLLERFWPGPLTLVLPKREEVPDIVTAGLSTVAIRMPNHPVAWSLIELTESPIAAPSANPFGYLSPTTAEHVRDQLGEQVDLILDGGPCPVGVESTILSLTSPRPKLLRPGGVPLEEIEAIVGEVEVSSRQTEEISAPGMLPSHYAPRTPIVIGHRVTSSPWEEKRVGWLAFRDPEPPFPSEHIEVLSRKGDLREAAANLFAAIRRLDSMKLDLIIAEPVPEVGLGRAIMDRLKRASQKGSYPP